MSSPESALKPTEFHLLLALLDRPLHGYALAQRIESESEGRVRMLPGNLYAVLRRMVRDGLVAEADGRHDDDRPDARRRYFTLTTAGRELLLREAQRLARATELLRARLADAGTVDGEVTL